MQEAVFLSLFGEAMTAYLIRRVFQAILVVFISAVASYVLLSFAPGGPMAGLRQIQQSSPLPDHGRRYRPHPRLL